MPADHEPAASDDESIAGIEHSLQEATSLRKYLEENRLVSSGSGGKTEERPLEYWLEQLDSNERHARQKALLALRAFDLEKRVPALVKATRNQDTLIRLIAVVELGRMGRQAAAAVPALAEALTDRQERVFSAAVRALADIGPAAREALPELEKMRVRFLGAHGEKLVKEAIEKIRAAPPGNSP